MSHQTLLKIELKQNSDLCSCLSGGFQMFIQLCFLLNLQSRLRLVRQSGFSLVQEIASIQMGLALTEQLHLVTGKPLVQIHQS